MSAEPEPAQGLEDRTPLGAPTLSMSPEQKLEVASHNNAFIKVVEENDPSLSQSRNAVVVKWKSDKANQLLQSSIFAGSNPGMKEVCNNWLSSTFFPDCFPTDDCSSLH
jgi:hypothetical protein